MYYIVVVRNPPSQLHCHLDCMPSTYHLAGEAVLPALIITGRAYMQKSTVFTCNNAAKPPDALEAQQSCYVRFHPLIAALGVDQLLTAEGDIFSSTTHGQTNSCPSTMPPQLCLLEADPYMSECGACMHVMLYVRWHR